MLATSNIYKGKEDQDANFPQKGIKEKESQSQAEPNWKPRLTLPVNREEHVRGQPYTRKNLTAKQKINKFSVKKIIFLKFKKEIHTHDNEQLKGRSACIYKSSAKGPTRFAHSLPILNSLSTQRVQLQQSVKRFIVFLITAGNAFRQQSVNGKSSFLVVAF